MDFAKIMLASFFLIAIPSGAFAREPVLQEFYAVPASPKALPIPISMGEFWSSLNEPVCESVEYRPTWWLPQNVEVRRAIYYPAMAQVACEYGLPTRLLDAVIAQESGYNPRAISPVGAMGMMQVMPGTARSLGLAFPWDPIANMRAGARYLRDQANRFGRIDLALAAYNAGPERKSLKAGYIPAIPETMTYVRTITTNWARLAAPTGDAKRRQELMTHPLITFLKTPMAAPETRTLRRMRRLWMALCWSLALAVLLLPLLKVLLGPWAGLPALLLTVAALFHGLVYFRAKARADDAFGREFRP